MYNKGLFADWVPKPVMLLMVLLFQFFFLALNGVYTTNISYMAYSTGNQQEYYMWGYYAGYVGMAIAMPLVARIKARYRVKEIIVAVLLVCAACFFLIATNPHPYIVVLCSLVIGYAKMFGSMQTLLIIMFLISKDGNRGRFYSVFYPYAIIASQITSYWVTVLSYHYNWQTAYLYISAACLLMAMVSILFQHNQRYVKKIPLHYVDWLGALLFGISFMALAYIFAFGKQQDWYHSERIILATIIFVFTFMMLLIHMHSVKRPYMKLSVFKKSNVRHGLLMQFFTGLFLGVSTLQTTFAVGILGYSPYTNSKLILLMIPGMIMGGMIGIFWFNRKFPVKFYIFLGFSAYILYCIYMYFGMVKNFSFSMWIVPMFLRGLGTCILFISIWYYTLDKLKPEEMLPAFGLILGWRSFVAIGIFTALFSWMQYDFQWQSINNLAVHLDSTMIPQSALSGKLKEAQVNAILAANKEIYGYTILAGLLILVYVYFHHFGKIEHTVLRFWRNMVGKNMIYLRRTSEERMYREHIVEEEAQATIHK